VGGQEAKVVRASAESVHVVLPSLARGFYPVKLQAGTDGYADLT
jgi:hypothetical protein